MLNFFSHYKNLNMVKMQSPNIRNFSAKEKRIKRLAEKIFAQTDMDLEDAPRFLCVCPIPFSV